MRFDQSELSLCYEAQFVYERKRTTLERLNDMLLGVYDQKFADEVWESFNRPPLWDLARTK